MSREAMKQMLSALETLMLLEDEDCGVEKCRECQALRPVWAAMKAGKEALDAPNEPVAFFHLTDKEIDEMYVQHHNEFGECISGDWGYERAIEAKLKEKNGG